MALESALALPRAADVACLFLYLLPESPYSSGTIRFVGRQQIEALISADRRSEMTWSMSQHTIDRIEICSEALESKTKQHSWLWN